MNLLSFFKSRKAGKAIKKVAVIGSGVMGSGIAAQIANAGVPVVLLDIVPAGADDRSKLAKGAVERMLKTQPAPLMHPARAQNIVTGNLEDDIHLLATCDWVIEVVLEDLAVKRALYEKLETVCAKDTVISSNTSTIPLEKLVEGRSDHFKRNFLITHFFNPPRYMRLLEIVVGPHSCANVVKSITAFCDVKLGKGVVKCNDTPGFIVNRILTYFLECGMDIAAADGISVEMADAVLSKPVGIPGTGVFGLVDLVGVDLMPHLARSLLASLPADDPYVQDHRENELISKMIAAGYTGRKGKGGFFKLDAQRNKLALKLDAASFDPETSYAPANAVKLESIQAAKAGLRALLDHPDAGGRYAWKVLSKTLSYAASLVPAIADTPAAVDDAVRMGCNWKWGPFELIDAMGPKYFADRLRAEGRNVPALLDAVGEGRFYKVEGGKPYYFAVDGTYKAIERAEGVLLLSDIKLSGIPLIKTATASVWDVGQGVLCLEFTGKMNVFDAPVFEAIQSACDLIEGNKNYKGLVIYNEGSVFSAGANLAAMIEAMKQGNWEALEDMILEGQAAFSRIKFAPFPVVGAPAGLALGGGCEVFLACDHVQAHAELQCGLVEVGVGFIPGWGGCKEMLARMYARMGAQGPMPFVQQAFETIANAKTSKSADDARDIGYLKTGDGITMNRERLLFDAREKVLELAKKYKAPMPLSVPLPGPSGKALLDLTAGEWQTAGKATAYDGVVFAALASALSGGEGASPETLVEEPVLLDLERENFMQLARNEKTLERIEYMLAKGKPLKN